MKKMLVLSGLAAIAVQPAFACDLCSLYAATEAQGESGSGFFAGAAEQFTHFGALQEDGHKIPGEGQFIDSSISQIFAGYNFNDRIGVQINLPIIYRAYGAHDFHDSVSGIGDLSLLGNFRPVQLMSENYAFNWTLLGGIKFPTGDSAKLNVPDDALPEGVGGHDLALGSGSYDGVIGTGIYGRWKRFFFTANTQYAIRSEGDFEHQYANDLIWYGGPGYYFVLDDSFTIAVQIVVSGEYKGKDTFAGVADDDSAETLVYVGPEIDFTWASRLSAQIGADLPVSRDNSGVQVLPDYRIRAALTWRF